MPDPFFDGRTLDVSAAERHDRICDRFEAGWKAGTPPRAEDLLGEVPEAERPALLAALIRVEIDYRSANPPTPEEYRARFPELAAQIDALFRRAPASPTGFIDPAGSPPSIPGYEILGLLGQGGMGVVFRGRHIGLGRPVAIKMVKADPMAGLDRLLRFELEARAVAGLSHANVVPLYDFGYAAGCPYFVMEFVEGGSLAARLDRAPADATWTAGIVAQLARAMHYVHGRRIVHRDLKPANVLLTTDGVPKITDFGLAKHLAADDDPGLTHTVHVMGTAYYMSPEQARGDAKAVGPVSDVYALGGILYEGLTGRPPFRAATVPLTVQMVLNDDPTRPTDIVPGVPADLEAVCLKCLEKDPADRYTTAAELADDLDRYLANEPPLARPLLGPARDTRWARRLGYEALDPVETTRWAGTYRARRGPLAETVLLKVSAGKVGTPAHAALRHEAEVQMGLASPFLIRMLDYGEQFDQPYLVLEDVAGPPLDRGPVMPARAAALGLMMALGLQAVHDHGLVHCGLHPGAVVLGKDGSPRIGGFTAARRTAGPADPAAPVPEWVGPAYQAPEVWAGDWSAVRPAADIYSLGAVLYDLLTGRPPSGRPKPPTRTEPALDAIVLQCLRKDPARRYEKAGGLMLALQCYLQPRVTDSTVLPMSAPAPPSTSRYSLRVVDGPDLIGRTFPVPRAPLRIGRGPANQVDLSKPEVSKSHCVVVWNEETGAHELVDAGSLWGTFLNEARVWASRRCQPGDRIRVKPYVLRFEMEPEDDGDV